MIVNFSIKCKKLINRERRVGNFTPNYNFWSILKTYFEHKIKICF